MARFDEPWLDASEARRTWPVRSTRPCIVRESFLWTFKLWRAPVQLLPYKACPSLVTRAPRSSVSSSRWHVDTRPCGILLPFELFYRRLFFKRLLYFFFFLLVCTHWFFFFFLKKRIFFSVIKNRTRKIGSRNRRSFKSRYNFFKYCNLLWLFIVMYSIIRESENETKFSIAL